jgi:hypothetical protein
MSEGLFCWPRLQPGSYPCTCGNAGTVVVDSDAVAYCNRRATPSDALEPLFGFPYKLPHQLRVQRTSEPTEGGGTDDRPRGRKSPPEGPEGRAPVLSRRLEVTIPWLLCLQRVFTNRVFTRGREGVRPRKPAWLHA